MANLGKLITTFGANLKPLNRSVSMAQRSFRRYQNVGTKSLGRIRSAVFSLQGAFAGLSAAFIIGDTIRKGAKFEQTMIRVGAVANATADQFHDLTNVAKELGETTEWTATQAAEGLQFLSMAGFEAKESIAAIPEVLNLATAGSIELGRAADIASNVLTALRLETKDLTRVNDVLVKGFTSANVNMEMLAESFKYAGSVGAAFGYTMEEITGFIGQLGNAGIQGSMAGTQLAMAFQKSGEAFDYFREKGVNVSNYTKDLTGALRLLEDAGADASEVMDIFGQRAGRGVAALLGVGTKAVEEYTDSLRDAEGETQRIAEEFRSTTIGQWKEFVSVVQSVQLEAFADQTGALNRLIQDMTKYVRESKDEILELVDELVKLVRFFGRTLRDIGSLIGNFRNFRIIIEGVTGALMGLMTVKIVGFLGNIAAGIVRVIASMKALRTSIIATESLVATSQALNWSVTGAGAWGAAASGGLVAALGGIPAIVAGIAAAVGGLGFIFRDEIVQMLNPTKKLEAELRKAEEATTELKNHTDELIGIYTDLSDETDLTASKQIKLADTISELSRLFPELTEKINDGTVKLKDLNKEAKQLILERGIEVDTKKLDIAKEELKSLEHEIKILNKSSELEFGGFGGITGPLRMGDTSLRNTEESSERAAEGIKKASDEIAILEEKIDNYARAVRTAAQDLKTLQITGITLTGWQDVYDMFDISRAEIQELVIKPFFTMQESLQQMEGPTRNIFETVRKEFDKIDDVAEESNKDVVSAFDQAQKQILSIQRQQNKELALLNLEGIEKRIAQSRFEMQEQVYQLKDQQDRVLQIEGLTESERLRIIQQFQNRIDQAERNHTQRVLKIRENAADKELELERRKNEELLRETLGRLEKETQEEQRARENLQRSATNITMRYEPEVDYLRNIAELKKLREETNKYGESLISETVYQRARADQLNRLKRSMQNVLMLSRDMKDGMVVALSEYADAATDAADNFYRVWRNALQKTEDQLVDFVTEGKFNIKELADTIYRELTRAFIRTNITGPLTSMMGSNISGENAGALFGNNSMGQLFGGFMEKGGDVNKDEWYITGEKGLEVFAPGKDGKLISNNDLANGLGYTNEINRIDGMVDQSNFDSTTINNDNKQSVKIDSINIYQGNGGTRAETPRRSTRTERFNDRQVMEELGNALMEASR